MGILLTTPCWWKSQEDFPVYKYCWGLGTKAFGNFSTWPASELKALQNFLGRTQNTSEVRSQETKD